MQFQQYIHEMEVHLQRDSQAGISLLKIKTTQQFIMLKGGCGRMVDEPITQQPYIVEIPNQPCCNYLKSLHTYHWLLPHDLSLD